MSERPDRLAAVLEQIKREAQRGEFRVTQHAQQEMVEEEITLDEVLEAISKSEILEHYPEHRRGACCLLNGVTNERRALHVVCTSPPPPLILITVYQPKPPEVDNAPSKEKQAMKCSIRGCPGEYEERTIVHTVKYRGDVLVIDHVPAEVCAVCGDVLLTPETVRRIEVLLKTTGRPARNVPLYEFA